MYKRIIWHLIFFSITIFFFRDQFSLIERLQSRLSPIADPYSEAHAFREASFFIEQGFFTFYGLGDINYGDLYPDEGYQSGSDIKKTDQFIYTHYPPGAAYILAGMMLVFGQNNYYAFRLFAVLLALLSFCFFIFTAIDVMGAVKTMFIALILLSMPAVTNMAHGLHYQGYAYSFIFLQFGVLQMFISKKTSFKTTLILNIILSFIQGYLSFDFAFLTMLCPVFLLASSLPLRDIMLLCAASSFGFTIAHSLHFLQVWLYFGNLHETMNSFLNIAADRKRSPVSLLELLYSYIFIYFPSQDYFRFNFIWFQLPVLVFLTLGKLQPSVLKKYVKVNFSWRIITAFLSVFVVSQLWIVIMKGHAYFHPHFLPRHYLYMIISYCIIILTNITLYN